MQIHRVNTRSDKRDFVQFPFWLYRDCPQWVPRLRSDVYRAMNRRKFPFYHHSDAGFFIAREQGQTLGRIAVLAHKRYNDHYNAQTAFFYYFDCVNDQAVSQALFDAACTWARNRDLDTIIGPRGMLRSDGLGMLVAGFEYRAAPGMPYNYAYYADLVEAAGFEKEVDYLSGYITGDYDLPERYYKIAERVKERRGYRVKTFQTKRELRQWVPEIQEIYNAASTEIWGYYPLDDAEAKLSGEQLITIASPEMIKVVLKGDKLIGYIFAFPDVSPALQASKGRLWPFGWIRFLHEMKHTRVISGNGMGMLPEYQGLGAIALLYTELMKTVKARKATFSDAAQVAETNMKSMGEMQAANIQWYKTHRIYKLTL